MLTHHARVAALGELSQDMGIAFFGENNSAYLARAVSSVPESEKERLESIFQEIISAVGMAGLEAKLPVELGDINQNEINPGNHALLLNSKIVLPLTYATSDGRGWEMGFSYRKKLLVPIVMPGQKINTPSLRLPFQIPVVYQDKESLAGLLKNLSGYEIGFGKLDGEYTVIGSREGHSVDLRKKSAKHLEVVPYKI